MATNSQAEWGISREQAKPLRRSRERLGNRPTCSSVARRPSRLRLADLDVSRALRALYPLQQTCRTVAPHVSLWRRSLSMTARAMLASLSWAASRFCLRKVGGQEEGRMVCYAAASTPERQLPMQCAREPPFGRDEGRGDAISGSDKFGEMTCSTHVGTGSLKHALHLVSLQLISRTSNRSGIRRPNATSNHLNLTSYGSRDGGVVCAVCVLFVGGVVTFAGSRVLTDITSFCGPWVIVLRSTSSPW